MHRSALNELEKEAESNERLEFLGDAVLELITTEHLFYTYPAKTEGELTMLRSALVNTTSLAELAAEHNLGSQLFLSRGEDKAGGRNNPTLLADAMEAYLGALFLDQGPEAVKTFLSEALFPKAQDILKRNAEKDDKSKLQESVQQRKWKTPEYTILREEGPEHSKEFIVEVRYGDKGQYSAQGKGKTKQQAQQQAAKLALENLFDE